MIASGAVALVFLGLGFATAVVLRRLAGGRHKDHGLALSASEHAEISKNWMPYIHAEVRAACDKKGWGHQVRRKWAVRDKPVAQSMVDDYEWKLVLGADAGLPEQEPSDFDEGVYYVLSFDCLGGELVLQHDTARCGSVGPHFALTSFTHIRPGAAGDYDYLTRLSKMGAGPEGPYIVPPRDGWLRDVLIDLTSRFGPNNFSYT